MEIEVDRQKLIADIKALEQDIAANAARNIHGYMTADHETLGSPRPRIEPVGNATRNAFWSVQERLVILGLTDPTLEEYAAFFTDDRKAVVALRHARAALSEVTTGTCPTCGGELLPGARICDECRDF